MEGCQAVSKPVRGPSRPSGSRTGQILDTFVSFQTGQWLRALPQRGSRQRSEVCKWPAMGLDLLDLLSVAVLIHTVEEDGTFVVLAVRLDKLCTQ